MTGDVSAAVEPLSVEEVASRVERPLVVLRLYSGSGVEPGMEFDDSEGNLTDVSHREYSDEFGGVVTVRKDIVRSDRFSWSSIVERVSFRVLGHSKTTFFVPVFRDRRSKDASEGTT